MFPGQTGIKEQVSRKRYTCKMCTEPIPKGVKYKIVTTFILFKGYPTFRCCSSHKRWVIMAAINDGIHYIER